RPPPPRPTLFPYTTLFRSQVQLDARLGAARHGQLALRASVRERVALHELHRRRFDDQPELRVVARLDLGVGEQMRRRALELEQRSEEHTSELQSRENLVCR